jgi:cytochrome c biogenesis protein CcmG/thiol:disulfide interchange protein DsbE
MGEMNQRFAAGLLLILVLAVVACGGPGEAMPQGINQGNRARDFTLTSLDGREVSLSDFEDSVVLVNFWATWCPPCRAEIPDFEAAYRAHQDDGFVVLGINVEELRTAVEPFVDSMGMTYPVLLDERGQVMQEYRGLGLPMSLLIDKDGVIRERHMGTLTANQLDSYLTKLLRNQ